MARGITPCVTFYISALGPNSAPAGLGSDPLSRRLPKRQVEVYAYEVFIQKFLKGICGLRNEEAEAMASEQGIQCNWWRNVHMIRPDEIQAKLTDRNLGWHLNHYDAIDPATAEEFYKNTPFISTTAGTVERQAFLWRNEVRSAFVTALEFATKNFTADGHVFYGYLFTLGKTAVPLQAFAEEVRELNVYTMFLPFQPEGEIAAKIHIPAVNIEKVELYNGPAAHRDLAQGHMPGYSQAFANPHYEQPEKFSNVREVIL